MRSFDLIGIDIKCTSDQKRHSKSKTWVIIRSEKKNKINEMITVTIKTIMMMVIVLLNGLNINPPNYFDDILSGNLQGSKLGPLLFDIYL